MTPRSILLVAHVTPPTSMSAARRSAGLTRYLSALGHRVIVLTSTMGGSGPVPHAARTVRTRDLMTSPLNWRRAGLAALQGETASAAPAAPSALARWLVPDIELVGWLPFALTRALSVAADEDVDCVITSSPPASGHLVGLALQARGVPWVADFRDGWVFDTLRPPWAVPALAKLNRALERLVVTRADQTCAVTSPIADDLAHRHGREVAVITNGFDPARPTAEPPPRPRATPEAPQRRTLVHTGTITYGGASLNPLLAGIARLRADLPQVAEQLDVALIGPTTESERALVRSSGLESIVRCAGAVSHAESLAAQRAADGLLIIVGPRPSVATGKLFEYLGARRPIVVIGNDTAAARIVREANAGLVVSRDDPEQLAQVLRRFLEKPDSVPRPSPEAVERFSYPVIAERMADLVERAIVNRSGTKTLR